MKNRLWWSFTSLAALLCLLFVTADVSLAQGQLVTTGGGAGSSAQINYSPSARIPFGGPTITQSVNGGYQWEGFNSTNYLVTAGEQTGAPNPDIAVGPNDILIVVNRNIARIPNINSSELRGPFPAGSIYAPGATSLGLNPGGPNLTGGAGSLGSLGAPGTPITNRARLDAWLGASITASVCPTLPRNNVSCVIDNATVRYDQMHGRFVALMTVIDTGITNFGAPPTQPRRASWVLLVSRFAVVTMPTGAVVQGQGTAFGTSDTFIFQSTNAPVGGQATGGPNDAIWMAWYGNNTTNNGYANDGFGGPYGNINAISSVSQTVTPVGTTETEANRVGNAPYPNPPVRIYGTAPTTTVNGTRFDCRPSAVVNYPVAGTTSYCYFPTDARIGLDNDNIILVSPVINANVANPGNGGGDPAAVAQAGDPSAFNNAQYRAYAGTRVRVLKKAAIYTAKGTPVRNLTAVGGSIEVVQTGPLVPGSSYFAGAVTNAAAGTGGDFYDLYSVTDQTNPTSVLTYDPQIPGRLVAPFTLMSENGAITDPIFWEPAHVRGRAFASYSNGIYNRVISPYAGTATASASNYLVGARNVPYNPAYFGNNQLFIQGVQYITGPLGVSSYVPRLWAPNGIGTATATGLTTTWQSIVVEPFTNPSGVAQGGNTALLNVGDNRPDRVIFREGHLYIARPGAFSLGNVFAVNPTTESQLNNATVFYDVVQKLTPGSAPLSILQTKWQNTQAYAPMFDVPANVIRQNPISPINLLPYLEKLFIGTTNSAGANPNLATCSSPNPASPVSATGTGLFAPGLYDFKCGDAAFVVTQPFTNPVTGQLELRAAGNGGPRTGTAIGNPHGDANTNLFGLRGGAGIDPNDGSLWAYGAYGRFAFDSILGSGQWGTYGANYKMSFPASDPYNNLSTYITDVQPPLCPSVAPGGALPNLACSAPGTQNTQPQHVFDAVQILRTHGLANFAPATTAQLGATLADPAQFGPNLPVTRSQMARLVLLSMMSLTDVNAINAGSGASSFSDVSSGDLLYPFVEAMYRLGITKGCGTTNDARLRFCPDRWMTRGEMSVFIVRTKMNNVFPTLLNGCPVTTDGRPACPGSPGQAFTGDNFGYFLQATPYFADVQPTLGFGTPNNTAPLTNDFFIYVQKMFELKITNGTGFDANNQRLYSLGVVPAFPNNTSDGTTAVDASTVGLTRGALASFMVRAFFY